MIEKPVIVIAGASGFIGKALMVSLLAKFPRAKIIALSRTEQKSNDTRVNWQACDLFSIESIDAAIPKKIDYAFYLVHSMGPTAQLDQGSFADYDLILADNFSRAIKNTQIKQLVYLGGLIPEESKLSLHLQSRLEVEGTFRQHQLPVTIFRAGLILGEAGSSSQILIKLVRRLPVMICPQWTQTRTTPVDLGTVIQAMTSATSVLVHIGKIYDLAGCPPLTYMEMMTLTAKEMGLKRLFLKVPFFTPTLSRLWVSLITDTPKDLVYPLIESLEHQMIARSSYLFPEVKLAGNYCDLLKKSSLKLQVGGTFYSFRAQRKTVRSVQRLPLPLAKNAQWIKTQYTQWLPRFLSPLIVVTQKDDLINFSFLHPRIRLLVLRLRHDRSNEDWQTLFVESGLLVSRNNCGRLEFRVVLNRRFVIAAIHDFKPALPWYIYKYTQAQLHLLVMRAFARHLAK